MAMPDWELSNIQAIITSSSLISTQNSLLWWSVWFALGFAMGAESQTINVPLSDRLHPPVPAPQKIFSVKLRVLV